MVKTNSKKMMMAGAAAMAAIAMVGISVVGSKNPTTVEAGASTKIMYFNGTTNKMKALTTVEAKTTTATGTTTGVNCYLGTGIGLNTQSSFTLNSGSVFVEESAVLSSGSYFASCNFFVYAKNISGVESVFSTTTVATTSSTKIKYTSNGTPSGSDIAGTGVDFKTETDYTPTNCNGLEIVYTFTSSAAFTLKTSSIVIKWSC